MARLKRGSRTLDKAKRRALLLSLVDNTLDFGRGISLAVLRRQTARTDATLREYNRLLAAVDATLIELAKNERALADLSGRLLQGVAARYGRDSSEYHRVGGTTRRDIRRRRLRNRRARMANTPSAPAPISRETAQPDVIAVKFPDPRPKEESPEPSGSRLQHSRVAPRKASTKRLRHRACAKARARSVAA